jgi:Cys-tRNA(Pro)/Cys-tRNA(Cys) deacylase
VDADVRAVRAIAKSGIAYELVTTEPPRSAEESAALQGVELQQLLRTIVVRRGRDDYVFVLVPGGRQIDWPKLRAHLHVSRLALPDAAEAKEVTGYERGAITPLGSAERWPVIADSQVTGLRLVAIGAGARGVIFHVRAADLLGLLGADVADVTRAAGSPDGP